MEEAESSLGRFDIKDRLLIISLRDTYFKTDEKAIGMFLFLINVDIT